MNKAFIQGFIYKCAQARINPRELLKYAQAAGYNDMSKLPTANVGQITDADRAAARKYIQQNKSTPAATPQQKRSYRQKQWGFMTPEQQQTFTDWYKQDGRGAAFKAMFQNSQEMDQFLQQHPEFMTGNDDDRTAAIGARLRSMTPEQRQAFRNTAAFKANQSAVAARRNAQAGAAVAQQQRPMGQAGANGTYEYAKTGPGGKTVGAGGTSQMIDKNYDYTGKNETTVKPLHTRAQILAASRQYSETPGRATRGVAPAPGSPSIGTVPRRLVAQKTTAAPGSSITPARKWSGGFNGV